MQHRHRYIVIQDSQPRYPRFYLLGGGVAALTALFVLWIFVVLAWI